ncbi:hypothetical protein ASG87_06915 [Frateuria sp. Soil773]|uniref:transglutaminase-like domain-containing protein n=1 Tax=Frateuria sp. Soil773 TaxID=1736407 RepID=UPI0006FF63A5|nr:transglutaminase-like domain-containing protein [Frateuria sp. Soil773]KRE88343.1 hypothetical protein ASG87_06915 [Frateuria sp. Soil773]
MRRLTALLVLVPTLCLAWPAGHAGETAADTIWMSVLLGGRKIGYLQVERRYDADRITTVQTLALELNRTGRPLKLGSTSRSVESLDAEPLGFGASTRLSAIDSTVDGRRLEDGRFQVDSSVGGQDRQEMLEWPRGALLAEGQRRAMAAASRKAGSSYTMREFDPASRHVMEVRMDVLGDEKVVLPDGVRTLSHQRQVLGLAHGDQVIDLWLDERGIPRKGLLSLVGRPLEMLACSRECALAPNQDVDMFRAAMVDSPRRLPANWRATPLRYRVRILGPGDDRLFIDTGEQRVTALGKGQWLVDVGGARPGGQAPPQPEDSKANAWLQSDAPAIRQLAARVVGNAGSDRAKMRRLRSFVSDYITDHGLDVGYASALEVLHSRQGDCTEYAVLLAALARAEGIPARIVSGMVYADRYAGISRVFVPHEWVQAWVGDHWESYDAALRRFDATHLALSSSDGDPWHFFAASRLFGRIRIDTAMSGSDLIDTPAPLGPIAPATAGGER